ncbi:hypothetical protein QFC21_005632 [Naganishia friedmannii]|uniref:Uncharacterized protein n=1 Tax=Naganishia friedmannii TaxID=89922 RepID=A0ACC2V8S6_9TREE|nr:hypothetical protein QFC21_005632 [Naganishia friedmannii]
MVRGHSSVVDSARDTPVVTGSTIARLSAPSSPTDVPASVTTGSSPSRHPTPVPSVAPTTILGLSPHLIAEIGENLKNSHATLWRLARASKELKSGLSKPLHRTKVWQRETARGAENAKRWKEFAKSAEASDVRHLVYQSKGNAQPQLSKTHLKSFVKHHQKLISIAFWSPTEKYAEANVEAVLLLQQPFRPCNFDDTFRSLAYLARYEGDGRRCRWGTKTAKKSKLDIEFSSNRDEDGRDDEAAVNFPTHSYGLFQVALSRSKSSTSDPPASLIAQLGGALSHVENKGKSELVVQFITWVEREKAVLLVNAMAEINPLALCTHLVFEMGSHDSSPGPDLSESMQFLGLFKKAFLDAFRLTEFDHDMSVCIRVHGPDSSVQTLRIEALAGYYPTIWVSGLSMGWGGKWAQEEDTWKYEQSQCKVKTRDVK